MPIAMLLRSAGFGVCLVVANLAHPGATAADGFGPSAVWRTPGAQRCYILTGNFSCVVPHPPPLHLQPYVNAQPANTAPPLTLTDLTNEYGSLVMELPDDADPAWLASMRTSPTSYQELTARVAQLGRDLSAMRAYDYVSLMNARRTLTQADDIHRALVSQVDALTALDEKTDQQTAADQAFVTRYQHDHDRMHAEEDAMIAIMDRSAIELKAVQTASVAWLFTFAPIPSYARGWNFAYLEGSEDNIIEPPPLVTARVEPPAPAAFAPTAAEGASPPPPALPDFRPVPGTLPPGPEMQVLNQISDQVKSLNAELASENRAIDKLNAVNQPMSQQVDRLLAKIGDAQAANDLLESRFPAYRAAMRNDEAWWATVRDNAALVAAEAYFWDSWKEHVVKPTIYELVAQVGNPVVRAEFREGLTDQKVESLYIGAKKALADSGFNRFKRYLTVQNDTLEMLHHQVLLIDRVPDTIMYGTPAQGKALINDVAHFQEFSGEKLQRDAGYATASRLQGNARKLARKLHLIDADD